MSSNITDITPVLNPNIDYLQIEPGVYSRGLSIDSIQRIMERNKGLREEYLRNSFPPGDFQVERKTLLSKKLISLNRFREFVTDTGYITDAEKEGWGWILEKGWQKREGLNWNSPFGNRLDEYYREHSEDLPVMQVGWNDADLFCSWYSKNYSVEAALPSEGLWEAARVFAEPSAVVRSGWLSRDNISYLETLRNYNAELSCHPFGAVWEWTADWFKPYPGGPHNREFGEVYRVLRGGSLFSMEYQREPAYRFRRCPTARSPYYGFRIAIMV